MASINAMVWGLEHLGAGKVTVSTVRFKRVSWPPSLAPFALRSSMSFQAKRMLELLERKA